MFFLFIDSESLLRPSKAQRATIREALTMTRSIGPGLVPSECMPGCDGYILRGIQSTGTGNECASRVADVGITYKHPKKHVCMAAMRRMVMQHCGADTGSFDLDNISFLNTD